jgi:hypothetical protein
MGNIPRLILVLWWVGSVCLGGQTNVTETNAPNTAKDTHEVTPLTLSGAEAFVCKKVGETELLLHVMEPKGGALGSSDTDTSSALL